MLRSNSNALENGRSNQFAVHELLADFICGDLSNARGLRVDRADLRNDTPLFETSIVDSLGILDLMGFVEQVTGKSIPTHMVDMRYFGTIETIAESFFVDVNLEPRDGAVCPTTKNKFIPTESSNRFDIACPIRSEQGTDKLTRIDQRLVRIASCFAATPINFPTLVSRRLLERAEYDSSFPHLLIKVAPEFTAVDHQTGVIQESEWCLSPAVCYHVYGHFSGQWLPANTVISTKGKCFRNELTRSYGRRQIEFEMREFVLLGLAEWINDTISSLQSEITMLTDELEIQGEWRSANDPFFIPTAKGKAFCQRVKQTKLEFQAEQFNQIAICSLNRHETFFTDRFSIKDNNGRSMHTACVAFGLDRWAHVCSQKTGVARI